ncbi:hypothetical protein P171DRAFT_521726 [Karstenula rhodostoma CBS 690.94]|uniref:Uncharacterized protein n=1 Tax=Karstenula rhodostoma CBS 690.94 TaxID=1392251 RepID=A0A9P4PJD7_9PLEO|nr:hypothetical protein P171DRAFT_521726 [Karstenula rhodostoma CBS 690.94]
MFIDTPFLRAIHDGIFDDKKDSLFQLATAKEFKADIDEFVNYRVHQRIIQASDEMEKILHPDVAPTAAPAPAVEAKEEVIDPEDLRFRQLMGLNPFYLLNVHADEGAAAMKKAVLKPGVLQSDIQVTEDDLERMDRMGWKVKLPPFPYPIRVFPL